MTVFLNERLPKKGNWLGVLFDQNAVNKGTKFIFLERLASLTTLPDILVKSTTAVPVYALPKRISFFCSSLELTELKRFSNISFSAHNLLAKEIIAHKNGFPEWLWVHSKWKVQYYPVEI